MFKIIIYEILVIFAFVGIGYLAYKAKFLTIESIEHLTKLMINVTGPCMLVSSITGNEFSDDMIQAMVQMLAGTAVFFIVGIFVASIFLKLIRVPDEDFGVYNMLITTQNSGFMGFPLAKGIFGSQGLFFMVLSNLVMCIYMYTIGLIQINMGGEKVKKDWRQSLKSLLNPSSVAAVLGLFLLLIHIELPVFINDVIIPLGDATIPISMLVLGIQLGTSDISKVLKNGRLALITFVSLIIWPFLTFLAVNWLPLYKYVKAMMIYAAALPGMVMLVALAEQEGQNTKVAAEGVTYSTICSLITLPVITLCLKAYFEI